MSRAFNAYVTVFRTPNVYESWPVGHAVQNDDGSIALTVATMPLDMMRWNGQITLVPEKPKP